MNVYKRPMFLQGGGTPLPMAAAPVAAPPMAPPMAPPPGAGAGGAGAAIPQDLQAALAGAEQQGAAAGEQMGQQMVTNMMEGLDSAQDFEEVINAIRGDDRPISDRYAELGEIVGAEDAKETPESVLALVQPAIMMTEEGAMDSGIGNLMQELAGGVQMEGGMEEGVGALMAAGQPEAPPMGAAPMGPPPMGPGPDPTAQGPTLNGTPQGFAVGGAVTRFRNSPVVQNFAEGTDVTIAGRGDIPDPLRPHLNYKPPEGHLEGSLQEAYKDRLKLYEKVGARDPAADKAQFWAQMAQLGLNLAAPPPELRGRSPAEALAAAAKVPFANIAQLGARASEGKRATRFAALQAAEASETARRKQLATSELEKQKAAIAGAVTISEQQHRRRQDESGEAAALRLQIRKENIQRELANLAGAQGIAAIDARAKYTKEIANLDNLAAENREYIKGSQFLTRVRIQNTHEIAMAATAREQMSAYQKAIVGLKENAHALQKQAEDRLFRHGSAKILQEEDRIKYQEDYRAAVLAGDKKKEENLVAWRMKQAEDTMASRDALAAYRRAVLDGDATKEANIVAHRMKQMEDALVDRNSLAEYRKAVLARDTKKQSDLISWRMRQAENAQVDRNSLAEYRKLELGYKQQLLGYKQAALNMGAFGKSLKGYVLKILTNTDNLDLYAQNKLDAQATAELNAAITFWAEEKSIWNANTSRYERMPGHRLPSGVLRAMDDRTKIKDAVTPTYNPSVPRTWGPGQTEEGVDALPVPGAMTLTGTGTGRAEPRGDRPVMPNVDSGPTPETAAALEKEVEQQTSSLVRLMRSGNLEDGFGSFDAVQKVVGYLSGHMHDWFNMSKGATAEMARGPAEAGAIMATVNQGLMVGLRGMVSGRLPQEMINKFENTLPKPSVAKSDSDAADQFEATVAWLTTRRKTVENMLAKGGLGGTMAGNLKQELVFYSNWERIYATGRDNLRGVTSEKSAMENAPTSVFTKGSPDYGLNKVPGYDPNEHRAFQNRGEDYRAELEKRQGGG